MPQKPGSVLPLAERLAVQAELLRWRTGLSKPQRTEAAIAKRAKCSQPAIGKALRGNLGPDVRDGLLAIWGVTVSELAKKHRGAIERVIGAEHPEDLLKSIIEQKPQTERLASSVGEAVQEAAHAIAEDESVPLLEAQSLVLGLLSEVEPAPLELYREARRRLGRGSARSSTPTS